MVEASPMMEENAYTYICLRTQLNVTIAPMVELLQVTVSINLGLLIDWCFTLYSPVDNTFTLHRNIYTINSITSINLGFVIDWYFTLYI